MTDRPELTTSDEEKLAREARDWVMRLTSGEATQADAEALREWRSRSKAHRRAFAQANMIWDGLESAAVEAIALIPRKAHQPDGLQNIVRRRAVLGGAAAAAVAAVAGYAVVRPPLELWPSLADMTADYRTGAGQQQQITFGRGVQVKLNTRTSVSVLRSAPDQSDGFELLSGEALVNTAPEMMRPFAVVAAQGRTMAGRGRFNLRHDGRSVCVTCLEGEARVELADSHASLRTGQQIVYSGEGLGAANSVDIEAVTAWDRGLLIFENVPLSLVIEEVNRYRSGRIIVTNAELGRRPVVGTFRIDRIDDVIPRLQAVFGVQARSLPGGFVLIS
ncbi:FecR domain-containing protein [Microbacteriaceae bacterium K1510]|nr:FecR domain-containing protein [Microbacteriaceae bacterium K1510]